MAGVAVRRGEIYLVAPPPGNDPKRARPLVIVSRQTLCESRADKVICAPVNSIADGRSTEIVVGTENGLKHRSVVNCDQLLLVPKAALRHYVGELTVAQLVALGDALRVALAVEC